MKIHSLFKAKGPAESRTGSIIAAGETGRRPIVPVTVERDIPRQVADELNVIGRIRIETEAARLRECRKKCCGYIQIGFIKLEEIDLRPNHRSCKILFAYWDEGRVVVRVLPRKPPEDRDFAPISVLKVTPEATANGGLQRDALRGALQKTP